MTTQNGHFGLEKPSIAIEKLRSIKPTPPPPQPQNMEEVDARAEKLGFVSREVPQDPSPDIRRANKFQRPQPEVRWPLNIRVPLRVAEALKDFCADNRFSYPEALEEIMRRAGLL